MLAASVADTDGFGFFFGDEIYWRFHHVVGHNLLFGVVVAIVMTIFSTHRAKASVLYFALFHLHLFMDYWGSGPGWTIPWLWPSAMWTWKNPQAWPLTSWQNVTAFVLLFAWTLWIAIRCGRTPIEQLAPRLDRAFVDALRKRILPADTQKVQT
jgi:inner membrane protein